MSDEEYFEQLCSNSIDGTLTSSEREKLEAHLAECPSCAALKKDLEAMQALFAEEAEPPAGLHEGIMQRLEQESKLKVVQPEKPVRHVPTLTMVAAAAVVVLVVLGGGLMPMFSTTSSNAAVADAATAEASADTAGGDMEASVQEAAGEAGMEADRGQTALETAPSDSGASEDAGTAYGTSPAPRDAEEATAQEEESEPADDTAESGAGDAAAPAPELFSTTPSADTPQTAKAADVPESITVPESLRGMSVAHCYLAQGGGELPDVGGELLATDGQASWFLLDNDLATIQDTLGAVEEAGYTVSGYEATGLTIDSKALSWLLIVANG